MKYHFRVGDLLKKKRPEDLGLEYTSVQRIELNGSVTQDTGQDEACLVVIAGEVDFRVGSRAGKAGFRDMLYVPKGTEIQISSDDAALVYFGAPSEKKTQFAHIKFTDIDGNPETHKVFGKAESNCRRDVWQFIDTDFNASRLMMGLCEGGVGGWTVWPPHEHGEKREEVYVYFNMADAFGLQCLYEDMDNPDAVAIVRDGDLVSVPGGYHPNVGCPAGRISFIYCMASRQAGDRNFMDLHFQEPYGAGFD